MLNPMPAAAGRARARSTSSLPSGRCVAVGRLVPCVRRNAGTDLAEVEEFASALSAASHRCTPAEALDIIAAKSATCLRVSSGGSEGGCLQPAAAASGRGGCSHSDLPRWLLW